MAVQANPDNWPRVIAHADMDAFYASVEQLDDPALRGQPVLVGPKSARGVVLTASYEARPFQVGSAMPMAEALRRCPNAVVVPPRFERYTELSEQIMTAFRDFSPDVEALSLDEAFINMTGSGHIFGPVDEIGRSIKRAVAEATGGLTASVGISSTKYVAKVASGFAKPDGMTVVAPDEARAWLAPQSIAKLWGAGRKTQPRLLALGLETIGDVADADPAFLHRHLGSAGAHFYELAHARDPRRVARGRHAKSVGSDRTLSRDVSAREDIVRYLQSSADRIARRLRNKGHVARGVRVKLKTTDFRLLTRQRQLIEPTDCGATMLAVGTDLLREFEDPGPFRLVGMAAYDLLQLTTEPRQLDLFADTSVAGLERTIDNLIDRFGRDVMFRARDLKTSGTVAQDAPNLDFLDKPDAADR